MEPRELAERSERRQPDGPRDSENFAGYGVMGLPFSSGHVLGMRRFPASSVGPGYTSVWHRNPDGLWTFFADAEPWLSCNRYFGSAVERFEQTEIDLNWTGPRDLSIRIPSAELSWDMALAPTTATRLMNGMGRLMPDLLWRNTLVLDSMSRLAGAMLNAGKVRLRGSAPNRQRFIASPRLIWAIPSSTARLGKDDFGAPAPLPQQAFLGDFAIPQRGIFAVGSAFFEPFDPARHLNAAVRADS